MAHKGALCWLALALQLTRWHVADALTSSECINKIKNPPDLSGSACPADNFCGEIPASSKEFYSRLSQRCSVLFESYRSPWSQQGLANIVSRHDSRTCRIDKASKPSRPIVVSTDDTAPFVLCTVPKAGCTNIRKLVYNMMSTEKEPTRDALGQFIRPHTAAYPALWMYGIKPADNTTDTPRASRASRRLTEEDPMLWHPKTPVAAPGPAPREPVAEEAAESDSPPVDVTTLRRLRDDIPSFTVSRSPYVRMLSGFRDKMVHNPSRTDQHTFPDVNAKLGYPLYKTWPDTPQGFREFVYAMWEKGVADQNEHFAPAVTVCGAPQDFRYDFYLRLEDMVAWFPCWMQGLGLRRWTETGWSDSPHGRMYIGRGVKEQFVTLRSYGASADNVPRWDESKGEATMGERGADWDLLSGDKCWWAPKGVPCKQYYDSFTTEDGSVVPGAVREEAADVDGAGRDGHDTDSQSAWREFFDQETADLVYLLYAMDFQAFGYERAILADA